MGGRTRLLIAVAVVVGLCIGWPAYRLFFAISGVFGLLVAGALSYWHKSHPVKQEDIENKRPLGLD